MELKGHNLIIISLDSHFSKMERNVLTPPSSSQGAPLLSPALWNNSGGQRWFTTAVSLQEPWSHSHHAPGPGGNLARPLETSAQISTNTSQIKFATLGSLVKTTPLSVWLLTAGGVKSLTQSKLRPEEPCPALGPRRPLGSKGFENVLNFSSLFIFQCFNDIVHARSKTPAPANN